MYSISTGGYSRQLVELAVGWVVIEGVAANNTTKFSWL